uniref:Reverse transcriptase domain-containing protein n=1 Tax=Tanacetum cinerariifolium TaxID=118510 RepID=A0A6L2JFK5_TANCI|nr:reverse transcriptase domain-containing protein [Tanacetum cinerariifolium]
MADQRIMVELLCAPTEGYVEAIVVQRILAEHFELKHSLINMMTSNQFFGPEKDNPHDHIRWFNKLTSIIRYKDVPNSAIKLMLFSFSLAGASVVGSKKNPPFYLTWEDLVSKFINEFFSPSRTTNLRNEISNFQQRVDESFHEAWDRYKDLLYACPHYGSTELHQLDTFYNALNPANQDSLKSAAGGNLLKSRTQDVLTIIKNKYKCLAADGNTFLEFQDNIQGYVSAATVNYNQDNSSYRPLSVANQIRPLGFAQPNVQDNQNQFSQPQGYNQGNNYNQDTFYQASIQQNQVVPLTGLDKIKKINKFVDKIAFITFPMGNDDLPFDIKFDLREIKYFLNHDPTKEMDSILKDSVDECNIADPNNDLVVTIPEMFIDEHTLDYSSLPLYDDVDDDLVELESDNDDVYDDPFDSKEDKIKESILMIDELDPPRSSDFLHSLEYDSVLYADFYEVDDLPSTNNEDKIFNPGILIHENLFKVTIQVTPDKNVKKIYISNASLFLEDFNTPLYELPFHKEVLRSKTLLSFSSKNEEKVFNLEILTSKGVHTSLLPELSHRGPKALKVIKNFESLMEIFPCSYGEDIRILDVPRLHFYPS